MMPRLQAQEAIRSSNQIAVGTGSTSQDTQRKIIREWEGRAHGPRHARPAEPRQLSAIGIGVRTVPKRS